MFTGEGSTDEIRGVNVPGKLHFLSWDLLLYNSKELKEGDKATSPRLQ